MDVIDVVIVGTLVDHKESQIQAILECYRRWDFVIGEETQPTEAQRTAIEEARLKDLKAKNYLFQAIDRLILETMLTKDRKTKYQGMTRVQRAQRQALQKEYEMLSMHDGESVNEYFACTLTVVNKSRVNKAKIEDIDVIEKILRSMTPQFNYVASCSIEESKDLDVITIDELQSTLLVHEQRMKPPVVEEQALKISFGEGSGGRGRG
nr:retrovirus-related Pol polyprotein from transposon TNT 1-94 [Tanacetum cinerariifolium]